MYKGFCDDDRKKPEKTRFLVADGHCLIYCDRIKSTFKISLLYLISRNMKSYGYLCIYEIINMFVT